MKLFIIRTLIRPFSVMTKLARNFVKRKKKKKIAFETNYCICSCKVTLIHTHFSTKTDRQQTDRRRDKRQRQAGGYRQAETGPRRRWSKQEGAGETERLKREPKFSSPLRTPFRFLCSSRRPPALHFFLTSSFLQSITK